MAELKFGPTTVSRQPPLALPALLAFIRRDERRKSLSLS
jgi:hypothetical protein